MRKAKLLLWSGALLAIAGCAAPPETGTEEMEDDTGFVPWETADRFERGPEPRRAAVLPLPPVKRVALERLDPRVLAALRERDPKAWEEYDKAIASGSLDAAAKDRICRRALEKLVASRLAESRTPLSRKYAARGLELVAADGRREHRFVVPDAEIWELARKQRTLPESRTVLLYLERRALYHDCLLDVLRTSGLPQSEIFWSAPFTMLYLELRGIEEAYLKVVRLPEWRR